MLRNDIAALAAHLFQQPLRCCNLTSVAFGLSALGYPTTVDDLFHGLRIPVASVLDDGMTLAETHDVALRYVSLACLPVICTVQHFDAPATSTAAFAAQLAAAVEQSRDIHVLNFDVAIVHANPCFSGGHFSPVADFDRESGIATIADTNPRKYGRFWQCPVERLFAGCAALDTAAERARGMLVLTREAP